MAILNDDETDVESAGEARMTLVEHLTELRKRVVISLLAITAAAVVVFAFYNPILEFLLEPYRQVKGDDVKVYVTDPLEGITTRLKVAGWGGLFAASPVVLWQVWRFITPGLHKKEKRYAVPFVLASLILFGLGLALAYVTFPKALDFLVGVSGPNVEEIFSPNRYITFLLRVMLAFGLAFEFPIVLVFLELAHVVTSRKLRSWRRQAAVLILAAAAVLTPSQDPWSLLAMAVPMYIFYEASILIGRLMKR